ncbi:hypothetical protein GIY30_16480 [Gordonia sp. HNM0687]|uniref:Uncharacterized protein n=1 Tax=Gordonia mangrovi TaxID=2665643 RepID=A0A6L7GSN4_9ACTN|nr:hypothetical protein [Gordonia mangrovi]MXP22936.1 hypothetical protein [Gordonia mangrovi]UVF77234.1 hypothetical protein NWF22_18290 [Gordonia mangrovi]
MCFGWAAAIALSAPAATGACGTPDDRNDLMEEDYATQTDIRTTAVELFEAMSRND